MERRDDAPALSVTVRRVLLAVVAIAVVVAFVLHATHHASSPATTDASVPSTSFEPMAAEIDPASRYLVVGGGGDPDSSVVQLERDVSLVRDTLRGPGVTLFAGGAGRFGVREDAAPAAPTFRDALGALFLPRTRAGRVRPPAFGPDGAATYENVTFALDSLLAQRGDPLVFVLATHGEAAADPLDVYALLWGNDGLFVRDLVDLFRGASIVRPSRTVVGACHGGAFTAIHDGERRAESGEALHCGFFATTADRLASGCDGDPDRSRHQSYLRSFFEALARRPGTTMLAAHVEVASTLASFDVPFASSEHLVRAEFAARNLTIDASITSPAPEADAISRALATRLRLGGLAEARARLDELAGRLEEREDELADAEANRDAAWNRLRVALLERFPWLEDAYAPSWESRVERERAAIEPLLVRSDLAEALAIFDERLAELGAELDELRVREAMLTRFVDAAEFPAMLGALRVAAPDVGARFDSLRACERYVPSVAR